MFSILKKIRGIFAKVAGIGGKSALGKIRSSRTYLDYCSITPTDPRVLKESAKYYGSEFGNPSSLHAEGIRAKHALASARASVAASMKAHPDEIVFTASGTEANNLAIIGYVQSLGREYSSMHIVTSAIEHSSILEPISMLESKGVNVTRVMPDKQGIVSPESVAEAITPDTVLVSIMMVNNEIGTLQPIREIAKAIRKHSKQSKHQIAFHTDACQAFLYNDINMESLGVHMMTLDGHKVYGPKGIGMLYAHRSIKLAPIILGGGQEDGRRSGTEALPQIAGFAKALEIACAERQAESARLSRIKAECIAFIQSIRPDAVINGSTDEDRSSPHILNVSFPGNGSSHKAVDHEFLMFKLDARGVSVSTKSSCLRDEDESYVLKAIHASESIRISFGRFTTKSSIKRFHSALTQSIL